MSEINLFKTYLQFVTNETYKEASNKDYLEKLDGKYRIAATLFNQMYAISDFTYYDLGDVFIAQTIKAYYLFEFFESRREAIGLMNTFYTNLGLKNWKEYFQFMMPLVEAPTKHPSEGWTQITVERNENFERSCFFLEALALKEFDPELDADFKLLRGSPIYKMDEGVYGLICPLFVFEKIFKGLYFKLREVHELLANENKISKNFRSYYTSNFSEIIFFIKF